MRDPDRMRKRRTQNRLSGSDQRGSAIIVVLLVMIAVTIIGVMSINTSVVEMKIAHNEKDVRQRFYLAEGTTMEGVQRLADTIQIDLEEKAAFWHHCSKKLKADGIDFRSIEYWDVDGYGEDNGLQSPMGENLHMAAVEWRLATGTSAIVTGPRLYLNRVYGLCQSGNSHNIVEIGYYMRY